MRRGAEVRTSSSPPGISGIEYARPTRERMGRFAGILRDAGVVVHFRRTRGDDVSAACGQLRHQLKVLSA